MVGAMIFYHFYLSPFFISDAKELSADPRFYMSFLLSGSTGLLMSLPFNIFSRFMRRKEFQARTIYTIILVFGIIGIILNLGIYKWVIEPQNYIECPLKIGYKKNLLRDYVKDINECKKF
jgi:hypothetical protein